MSLDIARIKALLFDVDGTLRDTDDQFVSRIAQFLNPFRFMLPNRDPFQVSRRLVMKLESPATYLYGLPDKIGIDHYLVLLGEYFHNRSLRVPQVDDYPIIDGVYQALLLLAPAYPMGIVSNRDEKSTKTFLEVNKLDSLFKSVITNQTCRYNKPYPDPLILASDQLEVPVESCLMIGDTTVDMRAGKAAGAQNVGVLCGFGENEELLASGADLVLSSTKELVAILSQDQIKKYK